jgi:hypothetical protein
MVSAVGGPSGQNLNIAAVAASANQPDIVGIGLAAGQLPALPSGQIPSQVPASWTTVDGKQARYFVVTSGQQQGLRMGKGDTLAESLNNAGLGSESASNYSEISPQRAYDIRVSGTNAVDWLQARIAQEFNLIQARGLISDAALALPDLQLGAGLKGYSTVDVAMLIRLLMGRSVEEAANKSPGERVDPRNSEIGNRAKSILSATQTSAGALNQYAASNRAVTQSNTFHGSVGLLNDQAYDAHAYHQEGGVTSGQAFNPIDKALGMVYESNNTVAGTDADGFQHKFQAILNAFFSGAGIAAVPEDDNPGNEGTLIADMAQRMANETLSGIQFLAGFATPDNLASKIRGQWLGPVKIDTLRKEAGLSTAEKSVAMASKALEQAINAMTEQALAAARASISQQRTSFDRQTIKDAGNTPVGGRSNEQQTPPEQELAKSIILGAIAKPEFTKGLEDSLSRVAKTIDDRSGTSTLTTSLNNTPDLVPKLIASLQAHSDFLDPQLAEEDHMLDGILSLQHMQAEADKVRDEVPKNV